ncbi:hypothetical protein V1264_015148 [Littorina saxatilis]|uniref:Uncharacterized protein n=1 Tax=Littorina saxatilis TaxID=31220 RepID=A0AAN9BKQ1_9CAEN
MSGQITVEVNNTLNVTQVTFNVTVTDVNQPPFFSKSMYLTTVPEFVSGSSTTTLATVRSPSGSTPSSADIVDIVNDDPDTQENFTIASLQHALRAEYTNGTNYEGSFIGSEPITMSGKDIVAVTRLRPDLVYFVKITVTDGQGLSANTTLEIKVTDVNEPPSCPLKTEFSLDLLESVQTTVASVSCTDSDYNDTYRDLSYFSHQEADHAYFGVDINGDVKLVTLVPRDSSQLVLKAYSMDGGGLEDNTTLTFIIDRNHPPDCFPSYVPPDGVWENGKCFRVYPNCSDPTTPDGDKRFLTYTFTGSWTNGFRQTVQVNSTYDYAEFCYFLLTDGNFKIQLAASNGLGNHTWEQDVIVSYKKASPKFTTNRYNAVPVNETAAVGFLVETVQALVDGQRVPLVYTFTDAGTFDQYFAIDSNTGNITVLKDLSPLANTEAKFYVLATDPATSLNHSAPVVVQVTDINQSPTCSPTVINATVLWSVTPNDVITRVNCSDPDPTSRFSQLSYTIATPESSMWRSEQTAVKLLSRVLLDAMTSRYIVHVLATDTTFTATTTVTINIDRTPPKPVLRVSNVKTDTANIAWTFDQQYLPVISNFVITISVSSNIPRTFVADKTSLSYVITGLTEVQNYRVDVTANGFSANVTSDEVSFTTPPIAILQQVCAEIKLTNETWSRDLLDNTSGAFIDLGNKVENGVHNRLRSVRGYVSVDVRSFRSGSVYADLVVTYNQSLSGTAELRSELSSLVNSGSVGNLPVDSSYKPFYIGAFYIAADASLEYTSPGKISDPVVSGLYFIVTGYDVTATCSARTPGVSEPKFYWMLDGRNVTSMQSSARYVISLTRRSDNDPYNFTSSVTIKGVLTTESGQLVCKVTADVKTDSIQVALKVVRRLVTILRPPTSVVIEGSDVSLVCERRAGYDLPWQATLYRVESDGSQVQVEVANKTYQEKQANFTVQGVTSDVHYRCDVRDSIATAVSSDANIIIRQPAARLCPTDGVWTETPAGNTVQLECPRDYRDGGLQNRTCGTDGLWQEPDSSGCVRQDLEDWRTTVGQVEEGTTTNTTRDVVEGLQSSTNGSLLRGDVTVAVEILDRVAKINVDTKQAPGDDELEKFVKSANNVLQAPSDVWQNQTGKAMSLVNAVDRMGKASSGMLNSSGSRPPIESDKIVLQVGRSDRNDIVFPIPSESNSYPPWVTAANNSAFLSKDAFPSSISEVRYSAVIYRNLSNVFSGQLDQSLTGQSELSINSPILSLSLALDDVTIITPVRLTFDHITDNFTSTSCQFLNFSASAEGIWSTNDCRVTESNSTMTVCECDHLTNFAVLMSPYRPVTEIANVLNVFSIVGCSISIFCLILTLVIYFILWRHVRSDRSKLLLHLCVVLVIAYVTFLAGVNQVEHETACTVVAGLLHYLWLVAFFLMLSEGIDIFISIVHVFPTKSGLVPLLIMAYGVPLIIVGVSMGVTKMEGYGGTDFCWLSLEGGLLWAFVGPALAALVANFVFVALVIRALLSAHVMTTKDERQKAKSVVKAICVMTPILGLSWIFGVMSVNDDTVVFQVLFVIFNSLQGLMIFILHCLLSKQIREAMQHKRRRQQAQNRSTDDSTSKYMGQKQSSDFTMSSNDLDKKSISPFLQVDRQVQQMASKLSMLDNSNFMTTNDTPKVMALKNPVAVATDKTSDEGPPFNIQLNESTTDDLDNAKEEPIPTNTEPEFRIEAGNVKSISKPSSSPSEATYATVESARGQGQVQITRDGVRPTGSNEDNAQQSNMNMRPANRETAPSWVEPAQRIGPQPARKVSQTSRSAESSSSKGSKQSSQNQGRTTQERDNNSRERARERELSKKPAANIPVLEDDQHRRLDHVYGAGARISDDNSIMGGVSAKTKGGRPSTSTENIRMTSAPRNPIYHDAVPALSPTDRWVRVAQSTKPQQQQQRRGQQHAPVRHPPHPAPFQQPRPPSPRRMATSAESLGSPHFQPFAAPRQADKRHGNKKPPPQVAAKPSRWHNDPPVDYW